MAKIKLYVGCGLNGAPPKFVESIAKLKDSLRKDFEVLDFVGLNWTSAATVYKWDIEHCVRTCDLFVAICDERSTGLGYELCEAVHLNTPILALAKTDFKLSGLVLGLAELNQNVELQRYDNLDKDIPTIIKDHINKLELTRSS